MAVPFLNLSNVQVPRPETDYLTQAMDAYRQMQMPRWLDSKQKLLDQENQLMSTRNQYAPQLWQQRLQGLGLSNQSAALNLQYLPKILQQKLTAGNLGIQMSQEQLKELPLEAQAKLALLAAQTAKAQQGPGFSSALGKTGSDYELALQKYGADSPITRGLLAALTQPAQGGQTVVFTDAAGNKQSVTMPAVGGGSKGSPPIITGPNGEQAQLNTTAAATKNQNQLGANAFREIMVENPLFRMPNRYQGPGGSNTLVSDMSLYKDDDTSPAVKAYLKPLITQAITASQSVNELSAKTLQAIGLNPGVTSSAELKKSLTAQWPDVAALAGHYVIPRGIAPDVSDLVGQAPKLVGAIYNKWHNNGMMVDKNGDFVHDVPRYDQRLLPPGVTENDVIQTAKQYGETPQQVIDNIYAIQAKQLGLNYG